MILKMTDITAITSKTCMIAPKLYAKNPMAQRMINITATKYSKLLILFLFKVIKTEFSICKGRISRLLLSYTICTKTYKIHMLTLLL